MISYQPDISYYIRFNPLNPFQVLVNVQVLDNLDWATIFETMEKLKTANHHVYSYIVCAIPIDYIYNSILHQEVGPRPTGDFFTSSRLNRLFNTTKKIKPSREAIDKLVSFEKKYDITTLKELPWSVIFQR